MFVNETACNCNLRFCVSGWRGESGWQFDELLISSQSTTTSSHSVTITRALSGLMTFFGGASAHVLRCIINFHLYRFTARYDEESLVNSE
jgi:hypothetical protein